MTEVYRKGPIELRLGDYRDVLADVEADAVICDPPYGERTHAGHNSGTESVNNYKGTYRRREIEYAAWSRADVDVFAEWAGATRGWVVALTSHDLAPAYEAALAALGRYVFQPVPVVKIGGRCRYTGDGPASWTVWAMVARPRSRTYASWGALPGAYVLSGGHERLDVAGGKALEHMRALVRDYSRPGDLVCDPCAGGGTTLIAAALEGRRAIGAELDPETYAKACARIERTALTPPLPFLVRDPMDGTQGGLF